MTDAATEEPLPCQCRAPYGGQKTEQLLDSMARIHSMEQLSRHVARLCGVQIVAGDRSGQTPLMAAVRLCRLELVDAMLQEYGVLLANVCDDRGQTAAHHAVLHLGDECAVAVLQVLHRHGALLNSLSYAQKTPLEIAIDYDYTQTIDFLARRCRSWRPPSDQTDDDLAAIWVLDD